jgi:excisionase family DNA binding protein
VTDTRRAVNQAVGWIWWAVGGHPRDTRPPVVDMRDKQALDHRARCGGTASSGPSRGCGPAETLTLTQVSEELNVSRAHVYRLVRRGELTGIRVGCRRAWLVERAMLEEFITDAYRRTAEILDRPPTR